MNRNNTASRGAAIALALALTAGGTSLLFGDVIFGAAEFTQKHFQTLAIVLGTTIAAFVAHKAWTNRHLAACVGFAAITVAGTGLIVWNSLGRQTEGVMVASDVYDKVVTERYALEADLARDRASIIEYRHAADNECASGEGSRCRGARSSVAFYENSAKGTEARLKLLETPKPVDASAEAFGNLASALGFDRDKAKALSMLIMPYLVTLFFEFGTTISLGYAFSPKRQPKLAVSSTTDQGSEQTSFPPMTEIELSELRRQFDPNGSANRDGGPKVRRYTKDEAAADLVTRLALGERFGSQDELKERYGVAKSTMSDWLGDWERSGLVPARTPMGRCKALAKA